MKKINFLVLAQQAQKIAEDKKGENIVLLDVRKLTELANYFVIITANSTPQINAIASEIEKTLKYDFDTPVIRRDGVASANWKVLDFGGLLVHIMQQSIREIYNLEQMWAQLENTKEPVVVKNFFNTKKNNRRKTTKKTATKTIKKTITKRKKKLTK